MVENRRITAKDVYFKLIMLEMKMDSTTNGLREGLRKIYSHFDRWLWIMVALNILQILVYALDKI
jgi:hypothetical protein